METFESTPNKSWAVLNLSKGYQTAKQVRRGILLTRGDSPSALVQDEIVKPGRGTLVWAMHTKAQTKISGKTAVFERDNKQIVATILEPAGAVFQVQDINLEPPAHPTTDTRKLMIKLPSSKDAITIAVAFTQADGAPAALPIVPLAQWGGKTVPR